jgi:hypothetical protein
VHHRWHRFVWQLRVLHDASGSGNDYHRHRVQHRELLRFHHDWGQHILRLPRANECASDRRDNCDLVQRWLGHGYRLCDLYDSTTTTTSSTTSTTVATSTADATASTANIATATVSSAIALTAPITTASTSEPLLE